MKNQRVKKLLSLFVAGAMVMSSAAPVMAEENLSEEVLIEDSASEVLDAEAEDVDAAGEADVADTSEAVESGSEDVMAAGDVDAFSIEGVEVVDDPEIEMSEDATDLIATMSADGVDTNAAPYSSVEKLEDGEYTVTANVYVPGELNQVLTGTNAFLTSPKNPFGTGSNKGTPTKPIYYDAKLKVENGVPTLTVDLKNPVFQALQINSGENVEVNEVKRDETGLTIPAVAEKYGNKIDTLTLTLKDYSGLYTFGDCVELASILYGTNASDPEDGAVWNVALRLAVDFQGIGQEVQDTTTYFRDDTVKVGMMTKAVLPEGTTAEMYNVTKDSEGAEGELYRNVEEYLLSHVDSTESYELKYRVIYVGLKDAAGNRIDDISKYKMTLFTAGNKFFPKKGTDNQFFCRWENGKLSAPVIQGYQDMTNDLAIDGTNVWTDTLIWDEDVFEGGYLVFYWTETTNPVKYTFSVNDANSGSGMIYHGRNTGNGNGDEVNVNNFWKIKADVNKRGYQDPTLEEALLRQADGFTKAKITTYQTGLYAINQDMTKNTALYLRDGWTGLDVLLPVGDGTDYQIYQVNYDKASGAYTSVKALTDADYEVKDGRAVIPVFSESTARAEQEKIAQMLYGAVNEDSYIGDKAGSEIQYYAIITEGAVAEKPSVDAKDTTFTYDGAEKSVSALVPESDYYTVSGDVSKTLPGTYHVAVTLKDGYAWTDGTTDPVEFDWTIKALQADKPVAATNLVYNGETQIGVDAGTGYNLAGTSTAANAGTYSVKAVLADGYEWVDGTTDILTLTWTIARAALDVPTAASDLVYNGQAQTGVAAGAGYTVADNTATNAGTYTAVLTPDQNHAWADGTTDTKNVDWTIAPKQTAAPQAIAGLTYTGSTQTGVAAGEGYTVTGNTASAVGSYTAKAILNPNYVWADGSSKALDIPWSIAKAAQTVKVKTAAKTYKVASIKKKAATFKIGASAEGKVSYAVTATPSKKAAKYLKVDKNGKVTVKKGAPAGTYTVTVRAAATATKAAGTKDVTITVAKATQKITAKTSTKTYKAKNLAKKKATYSIGAKAQGKRTYKVTATPANGAKYISVSKSGKVTMKKGAPKGTYQIQINAAATALYKSATKTVKVVVK